MYTCVDCINLLVRLYGIRIIGGIPKDRKMIRCDRYNCCAACLMDWMNEKYNGGNQNE